MLRPPAAPSLLRRRGLALAAIGLGALLGGCGFALRGSAQFDFDRLRMDGVVDGEVAQALRLALQRQGIVLVDGPPAPGQPHTAPLFSVVRDQRERVVVGQTAAAQVRELQLRTRFAFRFTDVQGRELIGNAELLLQRDVSYNETQALAKEAEEARLYRDMQNDMVQQVVRRLAALKLG